MRVLVATPPGLGHVHPMLPLARAMKDRGHEVRWATGADAMPLLQEVGLAGIVAGLRGGEAAQEFWRRNPAARALAPEEMPDVMFPGMFGGVAAPAMLADLLPVVRDWEPELVVYDSASLAGPIVASMVGVPSVNKSFGALIPRQRIAAAGDVVAPLWRSVGREPPPFGGCYEHLYLDVYPRGLQPPLPDYVPRSQPTRFVAHDMSDGAGPADVPMPGGSVDLPLVYVTMGTVFNDATMLRQVVDALAALDVRLLVTVGPGGDPTEMGEQPATVRVERYVAQTLALGRCEVVISHGGSGTVLGALARGLPQLCLPQGADQFVNAAAVARSGAGLALAPAEASGAAVAAAVTRLLEEPAFRDAARTYAREIAAMPGPDEVAAALEKLT